MRPAVAMCNLMATVRPQVCNWPVSGNNNKAPVFALPRTSVGWCSHMCAKAPGFLQGQNSFNDLAMIWMNISGWGSRTKIGILRDPPVAALSFLLFSAVVRRAKGGAPFMDVTLVAILIGVAVTFILQNGFDSRWHVSVPAGVIGYVVVRLIRWATW